jgi:hypothetical protein
MRDASGHLVEGGELRDRILYLLRVRRPPQKRADQRKDEKADKAPHATSLLQALAPVAAPLVLLESARNGARL